MRVGAASALRSFSALAASARPPAGLPPGPAAAPAVTTGGSGATGAVSAGAATGAVGPAAAGVAPVPALAAPVLAAGTGAVGAAALAGAGLDSASLPCGVAAGAVTAFRLPASPA